MNFQIAAGLQSFPYPVANQFSDRSAPADMLAALRLYELYVSRFNGAAKAEVDLAKIYNPALADDQRNELRQNRTLVQAQSDRIKALSKEVQDLREKVDYHKKVSLSRLQKIRDLSASREAAAALPKDISAALIKPIDILNLPTRASNCLKAENIYYIADLIRRTENDLLKIPQFGRRALNEVKEILSINGLLLGTELSPDQIPE
jgi:hypothetical protein